MELPPDAIEDCLLKARRALAVLYEDIYPYNNWVQRRLREILNQKFGGSQDEFNDNFLRPTIAVLERLKEQGFPLVKNGNIIVHLIAPSNHLEAGEMFYQVGHTTPGTLALKFAKYHGNSVFQQPSTIEEREFHLAFTQLYIRQLRNEASRFGNQLMRVLLVCRASGQEEITTEKVDVDRIIPHSVKNDRNNSSLMETDRHQLPNGCGVSYHLIAGRQPQEHSISTTGTNSAYIPITHAVLETAAPSGHEPVEHSFNDSDSNLAYPPIHQATRENPTTPVTGLLHASRAGGNNPKCHLTVAAVQSDTTTPVTEHQPDGHHSGRGENNAAYPPINQAVCDDSPAQIIGHHSRSGANANNPAYPTTHQAVRTASHTQGTGHHSQPGFNTADNPVYPPTHQAVSEESPKQSSVHHCQSGADGNNPAYPSTHQAVRTASPTQGTGHHSQPDFKTADNPTYPPIHQAVSEDSPTQGNVHHSQSGANGNNPTYPPIHQAVREESPVQDTGQQPQSGADANNPAYPPIHQAVREESPVQITGQQPQSGADANNPAYPPIRQAVREDPVTPDTVHHSQSSANGNNQAYPSIHEAVREDSALQDTGQQTESEFTLGRRKNNPAYPPIHEAVREVLLAETGPQPEFEETSSGECGGNLTNPSILQEVNGASSINGHQQPEDHSLGAGGSNPPYPSIHQAVKIDSCLSDTSIQSEQQSPGASGSTPLYTPVSQAASSTPTPDVACLNPCTFLEDEESLF